MIDKQFDKETFKKSVKDNVKFLYRRKLEEATQEQLFQAVSYTVKDVIIDNWLDTQNAYEEQDPKIVYYMSMEFLMGRALGNNLLNLGAYGEVKEALEELGIDINALEDQEPDPALGNGGLGRLAACFLDSLATLGYSAYGCGIRYRYGMFKQEIRDGYQVEVPDNWLMNGNPFELRRPEYAKMVKFGGYVSVHTDENGRNVFTQEGYQSVKAVPFDFPIVGYGNGIVNTLRIWDAEPVECFQLDSFDKGDYQKAVEQENLARNIVEVLYPNDNHYAGKELRLKQQYFFISASVQEAVEKYMRKHDDIHKFYEKVTFQLNDTHPTVAIAELMRVLMDDYYLTWEEAWEITTKTCAYTNHTIMQEALEKWDSRLIERIVPEVYSVMIMLNEAFESEMHRRNVPQDKRAVMRLIKNGTVHMANIAVFGSSYVNGVAAIHTELLKTTVLKDWYELYPERFQNKTNGITQRRWLALCNRELSALITELLGFDSWVTDLDKLSGLKKYADDESVLRRFIDIKHAKKRQLADFIKKSEGIEIDPKSVFDIQIKRLHEYKRQLLNAFSILYLYYEIKDGNLRDFTPTTFIFGAKSAPGYYRAKGEIRPFRCINRLDADTSGLIIVAKNMLSAALLGKAMPRRRMRHAHRKRHRPRADCPRKTGRCPPAG